MLLAAVLLAAGSAAAGFALGRAVPAPSPRPTPSDVEHFQQTVTGQDALAVFERAAEPADLLGGDLAPLDPVTLRRLVTIGPVRFLAARTKGTDGAVCLVAAERTDRLAGRCVSAVEFARAGVVLVPEDGLPTGFDLVRWQPDGRLVWRSPIG